jgi:hypothetical protein
VAKSQLIFQVLAQLILRNDLPLRAVAIAGEAMAADARLMDYGQGLTKRNTGPELFELLESYETVLRRCQAMVEGFSESQDGNRLIDELLKIKGKLIELY